MPGISGTFGIAVRNFTAYPEMPDPKVLIDYGVRMEELGYDSLWIWDRLLVGGEPSLPIIEALVLLTGIAVRTRKIKLGTGVLVLPMRNPVVLAKQLSAIDLLSDGRLIIGVATGWYKREFDAVGVPFEQRGKIMEENLEILTRLFTEEKVAGEWTYHKMPAGVMSSKLLQKPRRPMLIGRSVARVLKRGGVKADGWLTYFYPPESFAKAWGKIRRFATEAGRDPDALLNAAQLPIMVGKSRASVQSPMMDWLRKEWDYAAWSESTRDSAILGTVDECVEQLRRHLAAGVQKIIFVPYKYEMDQIEIVAREIIPRLKS